MVPARQAARAEQELLYYERENRQDGRPLPEPVFRDNSAVTFLVLMGLALFYVISSTSGPVFGGWPAKPIDWVGLGSADAYAILIRGEWRRCITALSLHADAAHLAANLAIGGWIFTALMREAGSGIGWTLVLAAGGLGNYLNSLALGFRHNSLGASTAVFGAVGVLGALRGLRDHGLNWRRALTPMAGAAALLAFLGAGEDTLQPGRVDIGAHFFGFGAGLGLGALYGLYCNKWSQPPLAVERAAAVLALATPVLAWWLAFTR
jgi:membrane associated rhomboid family serine protease